MRKGERFTADELTRLRWLVRCVHCEAVPTERLDDEGKPITRPVGDGRGGEIELPIVTTEHAAYCPSAPRMGRPPKTERRHATTDGGPCLICGTPMIRAKGRVRKYCSSTCRSRAGEGQRPTIPAGPCQQCGVPMEQAPNRPRKYCSVRCQSQARRNARKDAR